jgi:hypothetical protein
MYNGLPATGALQTANPNFFKTPCFQAQGREAKASLPDGGAVVRSAASAIQLGYVFVRLPF